MMKLLVLTLAVFSVAASAPAENDAPRELKGILQSRFSFCGAACSVLDDMVISNVVECTGADFLVEAACEAAGFGPWDPLADACAVGMGIAFEAACVSAIKAGLDFDGPYCEKQIC